MNELVFPLVPRRDTIGGGFGYQRSRRRGAGSDLVGDRPYVPGDDPRDIDWKMSARVSSRSEDQRLYVRENFAEEILRTVIVVDRSPRMALYSDPWLKKPAVIRTAGQMIVDSAVHEHFLVGYLDYAKRKVFWRPPNQETEAMRVRERNIPYMWFDAPEGNLSMALENLATFSRQVPRETFVFLLSDFLVLPEKTTLEKAAVRYNLVPVIIQDPLLEASFPVWKGRMPVTMPVVFPNGQSGVDLINAQEALRKRRRHEERLLSIQQFFQDIVCDPVTLYSEDIVVVWEAFSAWAEMRRERRRL